jgi:hypothetical protein
MKLPTMYQKKPFQLNDSFGGMEVLSIMHYGRMPLVGCQMVRLKHPNGHVYRLFRWEDGEINIIRRVP